MESTNSSGTNVPNISQQVTDEHLRNLRHYVPDERVAAWSEQRYAEARALVSRQKSIENERRQAEVSRQKKELKRRMNAQKVLFKEQIEKEAKEKRMQERIAQAAYVPDVKSAYVPVSIPPPPPLPFNVMPDLCVWSDHVGSGMPIVYYDFARPEDPRVQFKPRPK